MVERSVPDELYELFHRMAPTAPVPVGQVPDAVERRMGSPDETADRVRAARDRLTAQ